MILTQSFYNQPTLKVAQDLLGCFLMRRFNKKIYKTKIVETEAYNGPEDLASHANRGRTPRNEIMFGPPGIIYVYFTYGMHYMLNIVTEKKEHPAAVLIRAVEPIENPKNNPPAGGHNLKFNGPARLTKSLRVDKAFSGLPIHEKKHGLWIENRTEKIKPSQIIKATRIGVDYAGAYKNKKWRFYIKNNSFVSKK